LNNLLLIAHEISGNFSSLPHKKHTILIPNTSSGKRSRESFPANGAFFKGFEMTASGKITAQEATIHNEAAVMPLHHLFNDRIVILPSAMSILKTSWRNPPKAD
jgi:hypothetical protein